MSFLLLSEEGLPVLRGLLLMRAGTLVIDIDDHLVEVVYLLLIHQVFNVH